MGYVMSTTGTIKNGAYVNEWKAIAMGGRNYYAHKFSIIGTTIVDYDVYELDEPRADGYHFAHSHSTFTYHENMCLGDVTTRDIPAEMDALTPGSDERIRAVVAWYDGNKAFAKAIVLIAYPLDFTF